MAVGTGTLYPGAFDDFAIMANSNYVTRAETNKQSAAIAGLQRKVGINSSASSTSHDYKLSNITGIAKALTDSGTTIINGEAIIYGTAVINKVTGSTDLQYLSIEGKYIFPAVDGSSTEVLTTDGGGNVSWQPTGGAGAVDILEVQVFL